MSTTIIRTRQKSEPRERSAHPAASVMCAALAVRRLRQHFADQSDLPLSRPDHPLSLQASCAAMFSRLARSSVVLSRPWGRPVQSATNVGRRNFSSESAADLASARRPTAEVSCTPRRHWARPLQSAQRIGLVNVAAR